MVSSIRLDKIGNREMYMNCAVVDIVPKGGRTKASGRRPPQQLGTRETSKANAAAQVALSSYPDLFVANLESINKCVAPETYNVVFDNPGRTVEYGDSVSASSKASFGKGICVGSGHISAPTSSSSGSPPLSGGSSSSGNNWQ
jgi:hypothetical protein